MKKISLTRVPWLAQLVEHATLESQGRKYEPHIGYGDYTKIKSERKREREREKRKKERKRKEGKERKNKRKQKKEKKRKSHRSLYFVQ